MDKFKLADEYCCVDNSSVLVGHLSLYINIQSDFTENVILNKNLISRKLENCIYILIICFNQKFNNSSTKYEMNKMVRY